MVEVPQAFPVLEAAEAVRPEQEGVAAAVAVAVEEGTWTGKLETLTYQIKVVAAAEEEEEEEDEERLATLAQQRDFQEGTAAAAVVVAAVEGVGKVKVKVKEVAVLKILAL